VAEHPQLVSHQRDVATAVERQHLSANWQQTPGDVELAQRLRRLGETLLETAPRQAYLAYVWATQLDARQWEDLARPLLEMREPIDDATWGNELALLRDYYAALFPVPRPVSPEPATPLEPDVTPALIAAPEASAVQASRLVAFYSKRHEVAKADYFSRRTGNVVAPGELWSWSQPFEDERALDWTGDRVVFSIEHPDTTARKKWRGLSGNGYLTSRGKGDKAKGTLTSPAFTLNGTRLSFSLGGGVGKSDVGVELLVDGAVVRSAAGGTPTVLLPVWWDVTTWFGKTAQLRVFDRSNRQAAFLDQVLLWN
jgi:hypothetical protein